MISVVVIGSGNVAYHICNQLNKCEGVDLLQNYNRKGVEVIAGLDTTSIPDNIINADVYIIAISDNALSSIYNQLPNLKGLVVHTSGGTSMEVLSEYDNYGVFYPLQSFKKEQEINFSEVPVLIEAKCEKSLLVLKNLAQLISNKVYLIDSDQRRVLHVAAVFANNFTNFMLTQAYDLCEESRIDPQILKPIINSTFSKIIKEQPKSSQTGPAIRNDTMTIKKHLETLSGLQQKDLYSYLTKSIQNYYGKEF